ncbi:MAG TPA: hypothetical protein VFF68_09965 [Anaerolineaceae bacterium]|nr:hypothetical protein [Anaerolineaceae bacterium]
MFLTILAGRVNPENWSILEHSYATAIKHSPEGLVQSFLIQSQTEPDLWKIVTVWKSQDDYQTAKTQGKTEPCVQMFCNAGSTPHRTSYRSVSRYTRITALT